MADRFHTTISGVETPVEQQRARARQQINALRMMIRPNVSSPPPPPPLPSPPSPPNLPLANAPVLPPMRPQTDHNLPQDRLAIPPVQQQPVRQQLPPQEDFVAMPYSGQYDPTDVPQSPELTPDPEYERKVNYVMDMIREMPSSEQAETLALVPFANPLNLGTWLSTKGIETSKGLERISKGAPEHKYTTAAIYDAINRYTTELKLTNPVRWAAMAGQIAKLGMEFYGAPGKSAVTKLASHELMTLPSKQEAEQPLIQYIGGKAAKTGLAAITGIGLAAAGKYIPNPWLRVPTITGGFMSLTALQGGSPQQVLEAGITILGFEAAGLLTKILSAKTEGQKILYTNKAVRAAKKANPELAKMPDGEVKEILRGLYTARQKVAKERKISAQQVHKQAVEARKNPLLREKLIRERRLKQPLRGSTQQPIDFSKARDMEKTVLLRMNNRGIPASRLTDIRKQAVEIEGLPPNEYAKRLRQVAKELRKRGGGDIDQFLPAEEQQPLAERPPEAATEAPAAAPVAERAPESTPTPPAVKTAPARKDLPNAISQLFEGYGLAVPKITKVKDGIYVYPTPSSNIDKRLPDGGKIFVGYNEFAEDPETTLTMFRNSHDAIIGAEEKTTMQPPEAAVVTKKPNTYYTTVPPEWREHKTLIDWGKKGLRTSGNQFVKVEGQRPRKSFIWSSEFSRIPTRLPKQTLQAMKDKTDEIWRVTNRKKGDYWLVPKQVVEEVRAALEEEAFGRMKKPARTYNQSVGDEILSMTKTGLDDAEIGGNLLNFHPELGEPDTKLTPHQAIYVNAYKKFLAETPPEKRPEPLKITTQLTPERVEAGEEDTGIVKEDDNFDDFFDFLDFDKGKGESVDIDLLGKKTKKPITTASGTQKEFDVTKDEITEKPIPVKGELARFLGRFANDPDNNIKDPKELFTIITAERQDWRKMFNNPNDPLPEIKAAVIEAAKGSQLFEEPEIKPIGRGKDGNMPGFVRFPSFSLESPKREGVTVKSKEKDLKWLSEFFGTLVNQARFTKNPAIIYIAETMTDLEMRMNNDIRAQLTIDKNYFNELPDEYKDNEGEKFFNLMNSKMSPADIERSDLPGPVKTALKQFKYADEAMLQHIVAQKRAMLEIELSKRTNNALAAEMQKRSLFDDELRHYWFETEGTKAFKDRYGLARKAYAVNKLAIDQVPIDWPTRWGHIQRMWFGQWFIYAGKRGQPINEMTLIGSAETEAETFNKAIAAQEAYKAEHDGELGDMHITATPELNTYWDITRLPTKQYYRLQNAIKEAAEAASADFDKAIQARLGEDVGQTMKGIVGRKSTQQKFWGALQPRTGQKGYSKEFWRVWKTQTTQFYRWKYLTAMNKELTPLIERLRATHPEWSRHLAQALDYLWGRARTVDARAFDNYVQHLPVVGKHIAPFALERWTGKIKTVAYMMFLQTGKFYFVNTMQLVQTLLPVVGPEGLVRGISLYYSKEGQDLLIKHKVLGSGGKLHERGMVSTRRWERWTFAGASERRNQGVAFLTMYSEGKRTNMSDETAARYARLRGQLMTQFTYSAVNAPKVARSPVLGLVFLYMKFTIQNLELLWRLFKERHYMGSGGWVMSQLFLGGISTFLRALGFVGITGAGATAYFAMRRYFTKRFGEKAGKKLADIIHHGAPALVGLDVSGSITPFEAPYGQTLPEKIGNKALGPIGSTAYSIARDTLRTKLAYEPGRINRFFKSVINHAPTLKQLKYLKKAWQKDTGDFNSREQKQYELTVEDLWKKGFGFRAESETIQRARADFMDAMQKEYDKTLDYLVYSLMSQKPEKFAKTYDAWNRTFPEAPITTKEVIRRFNAKIEARTSNLVQRRYKRLPKTVKKIVTK